MSHDDDGNKRPGDFVLARWTYSYYVQLTFVESYEGKPHIGYLGSTRPTEAYRWNSYHAARKYQRAHPSLSGYVVFNLELLKVMAQKADKSLEENLRFEPV